MVLILFDLLRCAHMGPVPNDWFYFHAHSCDIDLFFFRKVSLKLLIEIGILPISHAYVL